MKKCKICGMKTFNKCQDKFVCRVCEGKYGNGNLRKAINLGTYGKTQVILEK